MKGNSDFSRKHKTNKLSVKNYIYVRFPIMLMGMWKVTAKKNLVTCRMCEEPIDRGACGQAFAIVTIKDDRANSTEEYKEERFYLCDSCTASLAVFVNTKILEKLEVVNPYEGG